MASSLVPHCGDVWTRPASTDVINTPQLLVSAELSTKFTQEHLQDESLRSGDSKANGDSHWADL